MVCDENKDSLCSGQVYDEVTWWRRTRTSICETLTTTTLPWGECATTCRVWRVSTFVIQDSTVQCSGIQDTVIGVIWKLAEVKPWVREPFFHHTYTRKHTVSFWNSLNIWPYFIFQNLKKHKVNTCFTLILNRKETNTTWFIIPIFNQSKRTFNMRLGPTQFSSVLTFVSSQFVDQVGGDIKTKDHAGDYLNKKFFLTF